jgi:hypothetical protein
MSRPEAHHGEGRGFHQPCCEPVPSRAVFEQTISDIRAAHPDWSAIRVRQRALVEMYKEVK